MKHIIVGFITGIGYGIILFGIFNWYFNEVIISLISVLFGLLLGGFMSKLLYQNKSEKPTNTNAPEVK